MPNAECDLGPVAILSVRKDLNTFRSADLECCLNLVVVHFIVGFTYGTTGNVSFYKTSKQQAMFSWFLRKEELKILVKYLIKHPQSFVKKLCMTVNFTSIFVQSQSHI